jgi:hypothetical protein
MVELGNGKNQGSQEQENGSNSPRGKIVEILSCRGIGDQRGKGSNAITMHFLKRLHG